MDSLTKIYIEYYKRGAYEKIPVYKDSTGKYKLSEKQLKAIKLLNDNVTLSVGYGGAARSGKTILECFWVIFSCLSYPETRYLLGRKELKTLRLTVLKTMSQMLNFYGLELGKDYFQNNQDNIITFENKSQILMMDTAYAPSDPLFTRFGSLELTGAAVDESNETEYESISKIYSRVGWCKNSDYNIPPKLLECFNPDKGHVYRRFYKPYKDGKEVEHRKFIPALPSDNPHPQTKIWIENVIKEGNKTDIERLVKGNFDFDDNPDALVNYDKIIDLYSNYHVKDGVKFISADIARHGSDMAVILVWSGWKIIDIRYFAKSDINFLVDQIKQLKIKHGVQTSNIIVDEDGVGGGVKDYLKCKGFVNNSAPLPEQNNYKPNYQNLKAQCIFNVAKKINAGEMFIQCQINDDIKERINNEISVTYSKDNKVTDGKLKVISKEEVKEILGHSPDFADAILIRYFFELKTGSILL